MCARVSTKDIVCCEMGQWGHLLNFCQIDLFPNQTFALKSLSVKDFEDFYGGKTISTNCPFLLQGSLILMLCTVVAAAAAAAATATPAP